MVSIDKYGQNIDLSKAVEVNGKKSLTLDGLNANKTLVIKLDSGVKFVTTVADEDLKVEFKDAKGNIFELVLKNMATFLAQNDGDKLIEIESGKKVLASIFDMASALAATASGGETVAQQTTSDSAPTSTINVSSETLTNAETTISSNGYVDVARSSAEITTFSLENSTTVATVAAADPIITISGTSIDGYINGMKVYSDVDNNGEKGSTEIATTTNASGEFTLSGIAAQLGGVLVGIEGTDISTGLAFEGQYKAPVGSTILNPITTLIVNLMANGQTQTQAETIIKTVFGIDSSVNLLSDPIAQALSGSSSYLTLQMINIKIDTIASQIAAAIDGSSTTVSELQAYVAVSQQLASLVNSGISINLDSSSFISTLITNTLNALGTGLLSSTEQSDLTSIIVNINSELTTAISSSTTALEALESLAKIQIVAETIENKLETAIENETDTSVVVTNSLKENFVEELKLVEAGAISKSEALNTPPTVSVTETSLTDRTESDFTVNSYKIITEKEVYDLLGVNDIDANDGLSLSLVEDSGVFELNGMNVNSANNGIIQLTQADIDAFGLTGQANVGDFFIYSTEFDSMDTIDATQITFQVRAYDGTVYSNIVSVSMNVTGENDAPTVNAVVTVVATESSFGELSGLPNSYKIITEAEMFALMGVNDVDAKDGLSISLVVNGNGDSSNFTGLDNATSGVIQLTQADIDAFELIGKANVGDFFVFSTGIDSLDTAENATVSFEVRAYDGTVYSTSSTVTMTINGENEISSGATIDGYISGMTVYSDVDNDGVLDSTEVSATTNIAGEFTLTGTSAQLNGILVGTGGTDISTGLAFEGVYKAPAGSTILNPITTLIVNLMANGQSQVEAEATIKTLFGIDSRVNLLLDPIAQALDTNSTDYALLQQISILIDNTVGQIASAISVRDISTETKAYVHVYEELAKLIITDQFEGLTDINTLVNLNWNTIATLNELNGQPAPGYYDQQISYALTEVIINTNNAILNIDVTNGTDIEEVFESLAKVQIASEQIEDSITAEMGQNGGYLDNSVISSSIDLSDLIATAEAGIISQAAAKAHTLTVSSATTTSTEDSLTIATSRLLQTIVTDEDGIINLKISTSNSSIVGLFNQSDIETYIYKIKNAILSLLPDSLADKIENNITFDIDTTSSLVSIDVKITNLPSNPFYTLITQEDLNTVIFNHLGTAFNLPLEDAVYTGQINITTTDNITSSDVKLSLGDVKLTITTSNVYFIGLIEEIKSYSLSNVSQDSLTDLTYIQNLISDFINGAQSTSTTSETIEVPQTVVKFLEKTGLFNIVLENDGSYKIVSALFNTMQETDSVKIEFDYTANDGLIDSNKGTSTVIITGSNDAPVAFADAVTYEVGTSTYNGTLPGSYNINMLKSIYNSIDLSNGLVGIINNAIKDSINLDINTTGVTTLISTQLQSSIALSISSIDIATITKQSFIDIFAANNPSITFKSDSSLQNAINTYLASSQNTAATQVFTQSIFSNISSPTLNLYSSTTQALVVSLINSSNADAISDYKAQMVLAIKNAIETNIGDVTGSSEASLETSVNAFVNSYVNANGNTTTQNSALLAFKSSIMSVYSTQISVDTDTILNEVITELGVTVDSSILNPILQSTITEMKSFISGLDASVLVSDSAAITNTFKGLLDSIYNVLNDSVNDIFNGIDNQILLDTLKSVLAEKITLSSASFETSIIDTLTQSLNFDVESIKKAALESLLTQLGLDVGLLEKDSRDVIAEEIIQDVFDRLSMDEDLQDIPTLTYKIVDGSIITIVYDENGQDITSTLGLNSTNVTIDSDGSYTVTNSSFDTLNALYDVKVEFNYVVNDGQVDSEPKTVTITNEALDLDNGELSFGTDDYINLGNVLENVSNNSFDTSDIDSVDLSNGDHILSNLTIADFEAMVSEDTSNTLSIDGDSGDKIKLDLSTWSKDNSDLDNNSVVDSIDDGYVAYKATGTTNQTLTLLIDKDITVENV